MHDMKTQKHAGFTLIELVAVLLLIGIIITVVVSRWTLGDSALTVQMDVIKSHLRYAQSKAMSSSSPWYIHFEETPGRYSLYKEGDGLKYFPGVTEPDPDPDPSAPNPIALESGIALTASLIAEPFVIYDSLGRPYLNNTGTLGTQLAAVTTIINSSAGDIAIKPETGFIP
jgi:prepilin-type N-terminal cleavage/methylation domain-containing protein